MGKHNQAQVQHVVKAVPLAWLKVDPRCQRDLMPNWVKSRAGSFNVDAVGTLVVNKRDSGEWVVLDGQHRLSLLIQAGYSKRNWPCVVFTGLSLKEEARLFLTYNAKQMVQAFDKFRVRVTAEEPAALAIEKVIAAVGLSLGRASSANVVMAIAAIESVYRKLGPDGLHKVLSVLHKAWPRTTMSATYIRATGLLFETFEDADSARLAERLTLSDPMVLYTQAKTLEKSVGGIVPATTFQMVVEYNKRKQRGRLNAKVLWK